jgi:hypothetical protein
MNKEKLFKLGEKVNELFFKKSYLNDKLAEKSMYLENLL